MNAILTKPTVIVGRREDPLCRGVAHAPRRVALVVAGPVNGSVHAVEVAWRVAWTLSGQVGAGDLDVSQTVGTLLLRQPEALREGGRGGERLIIMRIGEVRGRLKGERIRGWGGKDVRNIIVKKRINNFSFIRIQTHVHTQTHTLTPAPCF